MSTVYEKLQAIIFLHPGVQGINLRDKDGQIEFAEWPAGVAVPTEAEIEQAVLDMSTANQADMNQKRNRKCQLLDALATLTGLTRKQVLRCFNEIVQDRNDD